MEGNIVSLRNCSRRIGHHGRHHSGHPAGRTSLLRCRSTNVHSSSIALRTLIEACHYSPPARPSELSQESLPIITYYLAGSYHSWLITPSDINGSRQRCPANWLHRYGVYVLTAATDRLNMMNASPVLPVSGSAPSCFQCSSVAQEQRRPWLTVDCKLSLGCAKHAWMLVRDTDRHISPR